MKVWLVSREYAGIAEAGGVKNVARSLSESLVRIGHQVTLFIPLYGCTDLSRVQDFACVWRSPVRVRASGADVLVSYGHGAMDGVQMVFVGHRGFSEKRGVYTYTREEEEKDPAHRAGTGHEDAQFLNALFQQAVVAYGGTCAAHESPDIIHSQDATAALVPAFLEYRRRQGGREAAFYALTRCMVTIHNAGPGYHHEFRSLDDARFHTGLPEDILLSGMNGEAVEPFLLAARAGATVTTVSPQYAREIQEGCTETAGLSEAFRRNYVPIIGITNGIDAARYNPADPSASLLPYAYRPERKELEGKERNRELFLREYASPESAGRPPENGVEQYGYLSVPEGARPVYIAYHGRVVTQKGISVLARAAGILLSRGLEVRFIFIGQGQPDLEKELLFLALRYEGRCVFYNGYDRFLSRLCMAVADFAVFPSFFEPCGLEDFIAQIYGTMPVAHATGGLCKIINEETGFLYAPNTPEELASRLYSLVKIYGGTGGGIFRSMIANAARYVRRAYSWDKVARQYETLYQSLKE